MQIYTSDILAIPKWFDNHPINLNQYVPNLNLLLPLNSYVIRFHVVSPQRPSLQHSPARRLG